MSDATILEAGDADGDAEEEGLVCFITSGAACSNAVAIVAIAPVSNRYCTLLTNNK